MSLNKLLPKYGFPIAWKSWWQLINSVLPYIAIWILMVYSLDVSYFLTLLLSLVAVGFFARTFIIFHDCVHGSFFRSKTLNTAVGVFTGIITFHPFFKWKREHLLHHATSGDLDRRGVGDIMTLTVDEYGQLKGWKKAWYQVYRHPIFLFGIAPVIQFLVINRLPSKKMSFKENVHVQYTNFAMAGLIIGICYFVGWQAFLLVQLPIVYFASAKGVWLFYVQHQYENVVWTRSEEWDHNTVALHGSSFLKLPLILQWFTGNIGFHHVHHLCPKIPNYRLETCHKSTPELQAVEPITIASSFQYLKLRLWDEKANRLVTFKQAKAYATARIE